MLKFQDILDLDEDKENRNIVENYSCTFIQCGTPVLLSLSASQKFLAVFVESTSGLLNYLYDVSTFIDSVSILSIFLNIYIFLYNFLIMVLDTLNTVFSSM